MFPFVTDSRETELPRPAVVVLNWCWTYRDALNSECGNNICRKANVADQNGVIAPR